MKYNQFGNTGLSVSAVGFGCARIGGYFGDVRQEDVINTLRQAQQSGINFYDTSDMYTQGESEVLLGKAFKNQRDSVLIASKGGYCTPAQRKLLAPVKPFIKSVASKLGIKRQQIPGIVRGELSQNFTPEYLQGALERSLRRLNTDHLDLYQLHSPPSSVLQKTDCMAALEKFKAQGKIRFYGVSCETPEDALLCLSFPGVSSLQLGFGLLDQEMLELVIPRAAAKNVCGYRAWLFRGGITETRR